MIIPANEQNLYEFEIFVSGKRKFKKLKGLVDTGSTDCACTYEVITTLHARPIDYKKVSTIDNRSKHALVYCGNIEFDGKSETVPIIRVATLPEGIQFILGMSILSKCTLNFNGSNLELKWKE